MRYEQGALAVTLCRIRIRGFVPLTNGSGSFHHQAKKGKNLDFYRFVNSSRRFIFEE